MDAKLKQKLKKSAHRAGWFGTEIEVVELSTALKIAEQAYHLDRGSEWVDVKEPPNKSGQVLVVDSNGNIGIFYHDIRHVPTLVNLFTHWQPFTHPTNKGEIRDESN